MSALISSDNSIDLPGLRSIPVIASFDRSGHIAPLYLRLGEDRYKVLSYWITSKMFQMTEYNCQVSNGDVAIPLLLTYHHAVNVWTIPGAAT